jgi:hypothetical protein
MGECMASAPILSISADLWRELVGWLPLNAQARLFATNCKWLQKQLSVRDCITTICVKFGPGYDHLDIRSFLRGLPHFKALELTDFEDAEEPLKLLRVVSESRITPLESLTMTDVILSGPLPTDGVGILFPGLKSLKIGRLDPHFSVCRLRVTTGSTLFSKLPPTLEELITDYLPPDFDIEGSLPPSITKLGLPDPTIADVREGLMKRTLDVCFTLISLISCNYRSKKDMDPRIHQLGLYVLL